jgi:heptaprenylglyceryl phosphate synthase
MKIAFHVDNLAVVTVLNSKSSKSPRVMHLLRFIVYRSMMGHFHMKAFHISSANNCVADALSRGQFQKFKELAPEADTYKIWQYLASRNFLPNKQSLLDVKTGQTFSRS